ncbi:hypothetical protein J6590_009071 [Homalodisca vitripennis]|nr:hypothetical protein J6590_009071 [Homalodisca vitripennis]
MFEDSFTVGYELSLMLLLLQFTHGGVINPFAAVMRPLPVSPPLLVTRPMTWQLRSPDTSIAILLIHSLSHSPPQEEGFSCAWLLRYLLIRKFLCERFIYSSLDVFITSLHNGLSTEW